MSKLVYVESALPDATSAMALAAVTASSHAVWPAVVNSQVLDSAVLVSATELIEPVLVLAIHNEP